jgi:hypothetical protein
MVEAVSFSSRLQRFECRSRRTPSTERSVMTGTEMSIVGKKDIDRHRRDIYLCKPVSLPDATGFSGVEPESVEGPSAFGADYSEEHSIREEATQIGKSIGRIAPQKPGISQVNKV